MTESRITEFHFLPLELVLKVFSFLPLIDLCRIATVCRDWNRISSDYTLWKFYYNLRWKMLDEILPDDISANFPPLFHSIDSSLSSSNYLLERTRRSSSLYITKPKSSRKHYSKRQNFRGYHNGSSSPEVLEGNDRNLEKAVTSQLSISEVSSENSNVPLKSFWKRSFLERIHLEKNRSLPPSSIPSFLTWKKRLVSFLKIETNEISFHGTEELDNVNNITETENDINWILIKEYGKFLEKEAKGTCLKIDPNCSSKEMTSNSSLTKLKELEYLEKSVYFTKYKYLSRHQIDIRFVIFSYRSPNFVEFHYLHQANTAGTLCEFLSFKSSNEIAGYIFRTEEHADFFFRNLTFLKIFLDLHMTSMAFFCILVTFSCLHDDHLYYDILRTYLIFHDHF